MEGMHETLERDPLAIDNEYVHRETTDDSFFCCQVCNMLLLGFTKYSDKEKAEIIKAGRPKPAMSSLMLPTGKGHMRHFNPETYENYDWLTGCERRAKVYCWPCLLFATKSNQWRTTGISDLNNIHTAMKRHASCQIHIEAMLKFNTFGKLGTKDVDETPENVQNVKRNIEEEVALNREVLKKLIRLVCFLSNYEVSPEGMGDLDPAVPTDKNKYTDFVQFMTKFDETLKNKMNSNHFLSSSFRNNLISSIKSVVQNRIKEEIAECKFVSIIVEEVAELGETILTSTVVRFATGNGYIRERFLNFQEVPSVRRADSLFEVVKSTVIFLECASKLVAQCYDGGVVTSNDFFQLQSKVKEICPNALVLHYAEHKLSSVLAQSLSTIKECKHFFYTLNCLSSNFLKSKRLRTELNVLMQKKNLDISEFDWNFNGSLIKNVLGVRILLIELFENISKSEDGWDFETVFFSAGYLDILRSDVSFNMLLLFLSEIFVLADKLADDIKEGLCQDVDGCVQNVRDFIKFLKNKNESFYPLYEETLHLMGSCEPPVKKIKLDEYLLETHTEFHKTIYQSVIMNTVSQLNIRFSDMSKLKFLALTDFKSIKTTKAFHDSFVNSLKHAIFDSALFAELNVLAESEIIKKSTPGAMIKYLKYMGLESTLPQTVKFCELALTIPALNGTAAYACVKNYIKNSSIGHKLSQLPLLSIEKGMVNRLLEQSQFYNEVIAEFAKKEPSIHLSVALTC